MSGFGGVVSFEVDGDMWDSAAVVDAMQLARISSSLGGVESLIHQPVIMSYWDLCPERRNAMGIKDNLIKYSCGIEPLEDIWTDIERALNAI
jgi:cystathionine gamma-synthase